MSNSAIVAIPAITVVSNSVTPTVTAVLQDAAQITVVMQPSPLALLPVGAGLQGPPGVQGTDATATPEFIAAVQAQVVVEGGNFQRKGVDWDQQTPSATWLVTHNLGRYPSVTVVDSGGSVVFGDVAYVDVSTLTISFGGAMSGHAYLN